MSELAARTISELTTRELLALLADRFHIDHTQHATLEIVYAAGTIRKAHVHRELRDHDLDHLTTPPSGTNLTPSGVTATTSHDGAREPKG